MSERNKKKVWKRQEREEGNDRRWSLAPSCESFRRGSKHGSVCLLWELREMCLCESALSSGSVCLWMFVCLCLVMYRLLVHEYMVCVCVCECGGQQFLSSLWGSCAGAKCPAAHRCLFTSWFTELTGKADTNTHSHTYTHACLASLYKNSHKKRNI